MKWPGETVGSAEEAMFQAEIMASAKALRQLGI